MPLKLKHLLEPRELFTEHLKKEDSASNFIFLASYLLLKVREKKIFENLQNVGKFTWKTAPENIIKNNGMELYGKV